MQRLKAHWVSRQISCNEGLTEDSVTTFEGQWRVVLPEDMREFYLTLNGMPDYTTDDEVIRFWRLDEVKPFTAESPQMATPDYIDNPESLFVFADYSIWAHAYAIRLAEHKLDSNEIFIIGGYYPILLFSFLL